MNARMTIGSLLVGTVAFATLAVGQEVEWNLNIFPMTKSFEVTAAVSPDNNHGIAGYSMHLRNVSWAENLGPRGLIDDEFAVGFVTNGITSLPGQDQSLNIFGGQTTAVQVDPESIYYDVGIKSAGEIRAPATFTLNIPWAQPVVLAIGGYETDPTEWALDDTNGPAGANLYATRSDTFTPPDIMQFTSVDYEWNVNVFDNFPGPMEGAGGAEAWLAFRLTGVPEPSSLALAVAACSICLAYVPRRRTKL